MRAQGGEGNCGRGWGGELRKANRGRQQPPRRLHAPRCLLAFLASVRMAYSQAPRVTRWLRCDANRSACADQGRSEKLYGAGVQV